MTPEVLGIDPRSKSSERLSAPHPLPVVSRRALKRVKDRVAIPTGCHYCGAEVKLVSNREIYGREYGDWPYAYKCSGCDAYVGVHRATDLPLGTLADRATREARKQKGIFEHMTRLHFGGNRSAAYAWLAQRMGIEPRLCHWGLFTRKQCDQAAQIMLQSYDMRQ